MLTNIRRFYRLKPGVLNTRIQPAWHSVMKANRVRWKFLAASGLLVLYLGYALVIPSKMKLRASRVQNVNNLWSLTFTFTNTAVTNGSDLPVR